MVIIVIITWRALHYTYNIQIKSICLSAKGLIIIQYTLDLGIHVN